MKSLIQSNNFPESKFPTVQHFRSELKDADDGPALAVKLMAEDYLERNRPPAERRIDFRESPYLGKSPEDFRMYFLHHLVAKEVIQLENYKEKDSLQQAELFTALFIYGSGCGDIHEYEFLYPHIFQPESHDTGFGSIRFIPFFLENMGIVEADDQLAFFRLLINKYKFSRNHLDLLHQYYWTVFCQVFPEKRVEYLDWIYLEHLDISHYGLNGIKLHLILKHKNHIDDQEDIRMLLQHKCKSPEIANAIWEATIEDEFSCLSLDTILLFRLYPLLSIFCSITDIESIVKSVLNSTKASIDRRARLKVINPRIEYFPDLFTAVQKCKSSQDLDAVLALAEVTDVIDRENLDFVFWKFFNEGMGAEFIGQFLPAFVAGKNKYPDLSHDFSPDSGYANVLSRVPVSSILDFIDDEKFFHIVPFVHRCRDNAYTMPGYAMIHRGEVPLHIAQYLLSEGSTFLSLSVDQIESGIRVHDYMCQIAKEPAFLPVQMKMERDFFTPFILARKNLADLSYRKFRDSFYQLYFRSINRLHIPLNFENLGVLISIICEENAAVIYLQQIESQKDDVVLQSHMLKSRIDNFQEKSLYMDDQSESEFETEVLREIRNNEYSSDNLSEWISWFEKKKKNLMQEIELPELRERMQKLWRVTEFFQRLYREPEFVLVDFDLPGIAGWFTEMAKMPFPENYEEFRQEIYNLIFDSCVPYPVGSEILDRWCSVQHKAESDNWIPLEGLTQVDISDFRRFYADLCEIIIDMGWQEISSIREEILIIYRFAKDIPKEEFRQKICRSLMDSGDTNEMWDWNVMSRMIYYCHPDSEMQTFSEFCNAQIAAHKDLLQHPIVGRLFCAFTGQTREDILNYQHDVKSFSDIPEVFRTPRYFSLNHLPSIHLHPHERGICENIRARFILPALNGVASISEHILDENSVRPLDQIFESAVPQLKKAVDHIEQFVTPDNPGYAERQEWAQITRKLIEINDRKDLDANSDALWEIIVYMMGVEAGIGALRNVLAQAVCSLLFSLRRFDYFRDDFTDPSENTAYVHDILDFFDDAVRDVCQMIVGEASDLSLPNELQKYAIPSDQIAERLHWMICDSLKIPKLQIANDRHQKKLAVSGIPETPIEIFGQKGWVEAYSTHILDFGNCIQLQPEMDNPDFIPLMMCHRETKEYLGHTYLVAFIWDKKKYLIVTDINFVKSFRKKRFRGTYHVQKAYADIVNIVHEYSDLGGYEEFFQTSKVNAISNENGMRRHVIKLLKRLQKKSGVSEIVDLRSLSENDDTELMDAGNEEGERTNIMYFPKSAPEGNNMLPMMRMEGGLVMND